MKKHTLIIHKRGKNTIISCDDVHSYLKYLSKHEFDLRILAYFKGDYKNKISRFGLQKFIECVENCDNDMCVGLCFKYDRA